ncbi:MAG: protein translocase subunit SecD [Geminicoccaceae bacterium]
MLRFSSWTIGSIIAICVAGLIFSLPNLFPRAQMEQMPSWLPHQQINLGLDLQGGSHLLLEVGVDTVIEERMESVADDIRRLLRPEGVKYRGVGSRGDTTSFTLVDSGQAPQALEILKQLNSNPIAPDFEISEAGGQINIRFTESAATQAKASAVQQSLEIVRRRIDEVGTREPTIQRQGIDRILVQVPGEKNPDAIKRLLGQTAKLNFHLVDLDTSVPQALSGSLPAGSMLLPTEEGEGASQIVVRKRVEVSGENLVNAQPTYQQNQPVVSFTFDSIGARKFGNVTKEHVNELLAIVLDDRVISSPRINEPILGGNGIISGNFTVQSANELSILLRAGALPAPLKVVEERTVGPDLGADSIAAGKWAGVIGLVAVMVFMALYYGPVFGVAADIALMVNLILVTALLSLLQATLTLPGIAGIVLTIGMAVDANVLVFERIREEARVGKSPLAAVDTGYKEAMRTIIDANVTTLIAAIILYAFGSGPIRGFAVTLGCGIVTSMFTAIMLTRLLISTWLRRSRPAMLPV